MKTLVYIIRHGQSVGNRDRCFLGHTDGALTELGREQARKAGAYLSRMGIRPDAVYASDLCRAYETAVIASGGRSVIPSKGLREIYAGKWEGLAYDTITEQYGEDYGVWYTDLGLAQPTGGERVAALSERVLNTLFSIARENEGKTLLLGTHATPVRMIEAYARSLPIGEAHTVPWAANASLSAYLCEGRTLIPLFYSFDAYEGALSTTVARDI